VLIDPVTGMIRRCLWTFVSGSCNFKRKTPTENDPAKCPRHSELLVDDVKENVRRVSAWFGPQTIPDATKALFPLTAPLLLIIRALVFRPILNSYKAVLLKLKTSTFSFFLFLFVFFFSLNRIRV
jgi:hypothetical protein